jgi:hypothetical protein
LIVFAPAWMTGLDDLAEEIRDRFRVASSAENCTSSVKCAAQRTAPSPLEALLARHAQLALEVQIGGRDEDVNRGARRRRSAQAARSMSWRVQRASAAITGPGRASRPSGPPRRPPPTQSGTRPR